MKYLKSMILLIVIATTMVACSSNSTEEATVDPNDDTLKIYTTLYPIQYAISQIAGDSVNVQSIYPPGVDAHSYEPTSKDMTDIAKGDAFIYLGANMEPFAETAADALKNQEVSLIELGTHEDLFHVEEAPDMDDHGHDHDGDEGHAGHSHGDHDPHIWIDPLRMLQMAEIIKTELVTLNPELEANYNDNFQKLEKELLTLDEEFTTTLNAKNNKNILVTHAAYGYWERYGIQQNAIKGLSSSSEPSQKELTEIIDQARESNLNYIVFEQNTSDRLSEVIQEEIGAETAWIHNLSVLMEEDIANNEDYLTLMRKNLETLDQVTE